MPSTNKRNWQFDFLKGISCIFVIFLHCPFPGTVGELIIYACRFPVPIFFMITGYYCYTKDSRWIGKKAFGILKMLLLTELFYGIWNCLRILLAGTGSISDYIKDLDVLAHPIRTLLFGTLFNGTLWYLYAAFWTYCILYLFFRKQKAKTLSYFLIPILLGLQIFGRFYVQNHYDIEAYIHLFRSALLFGLPLTLYGSLLAGLETQIKERINWSKSVLIIILGGLIMVAEYFISGQYMDFHLSTLFISTGLFLLAMTYPFAEIGLFKFVSYVGRRLSMWIYLSHLFFNSVLKLIAEKCGLESHPVFLWITPILVCICSGLFAHLASKIKASLAKS